MKRYEFLLRNVTYPEDVKRIRSFLPELDTLLDSEIQYLYRKYSSEWAAGWLFLTDESIIQFKKWALEELG